MGPTNDPSHMPTRDTVRIAAVSDMHYGKQSQGMLQSLFSQIAERADVLVMPGDLTDYGLPEEARVLAREVSVLKLPIVAVFGNHDYESGHAEEVCSILADAGVRILDGDGVEIRGVGFAGVKGFAGGFGRRALGPWGEGIIKNFVHECLHEALKLESALAKLRTERLIAILHYAPIQATVEGEPLEIYPFLGCSRLEEPLTRYPVSAVFHGHAHHGQPEGRTRTDVPVFNVSISLMREVFPDRPFRLVDVNVGSRGPDDPGRRSGIDRRASERETTTPTI